MSACAPCREASPSRALGRDTCLRPSEVDRALRRGARTDASDKQLLETLRLDPLSVLRPDMPRDWIDNPQKWLTNVDLDAVMKQYAEQTPALVYLGSTSIDFWETTKTGVCVKICGPKPFVDVYRKRALGALVINTDVHTGPGKHWVGLALDFRNRKRPRVYYYDSSGRPPPRRWFAAGAAQNLWRNIFSAIPDPSIRRRAIRETLHNTNRHQHQNTECGMFVLIMFDALIKNVSFHTHCSRALTDRKANDARSDFFHR